MGVTQNRPEDSVLGGGVGQIWIPPPITYISREDWEEPSSDWLVPPGFLLRVIKSFQSTLDNYILHKSPLG